VTGKRRRVAGTFFSPHSRSVASLGHHPSCRRFIRPQRGVFFVFWIVGSQSGQKSSAVRG
jgi:hypothetical protein